MPRKSKNLWKTVPKEEIESEFENIDSELKSANELTNHRVGFAFGAYFLMAGFVFNLLASNVYELLDNNPHKNIILIGLLVLTYISYIALDYLLLNKPAKKNLAEAKRRIKKVERILQKD